MLQRDYILEIIAQFAQVVAEALGRAREMHDQDSIEQVEQAIGDLLELDHETALALAPDSLVTMMLLSGMGDSVAEYVCYALGQLSGIYADMGEEDLAGIRGLQAKAVAESFGCDPDTVPAELADDADAASEGGDDGVR